MSPPLQSPGPRTICRAPIMKPPLSYHHPTPPPCRRATAHILECPQGCLFLHWIGTVREDAGWLDPELAARGEVLAKPENVGMSQLEPSGEQSAGQR